MRWATARKRKRRNHWKRKGQTFLAITNRLEWGSHLIVEYKGETFPISMFDNPGNRKWYSYYPNI